MTPRASAGRRQNTNKHSAPTVCRIHLGDAGNWTEPTADCRQANIRVVYPLFIALCVPPVCALLVGHFRPLIAENLGRLTANHSKTAALSGISPVRCARCGPDLEFIWLASAPVAPF